MGGCVSSPKDLANETDAPVPVETPVSPKAPEAEPLVQENNEEGKADVDEAEKNEEALVEVSQPAAEEVKAEAAPETETKKEEAKPEEAPAEVDKSDAPLVTL